jgi:hypothetical protein
MTDIQARLTSPHERSRLAFACWLREERQAVRAKLPYFIRTLPAPEDSRPLTASEEMYLSAQVESVWSGAELLVRSCLTLIAPGALEHPDAKLLTSLFAKGTLDLEAHREAMRNSRPRRVWQRDGEWHPARSTAVECVVGTIAAETGSLAETADCLNDGLPRNNANFATIQMDNIRNACRRFAGDNQWLFEITPADPTFTRLDAALRSLGWEEAATGTVWKKVKAARSPEPVDRYFVRHLHRKGLIFDWLTAAEAEAPMPPVDRLRQTSSILLLQQARHLKGKLKRLDQAAARGRQ